MSAIVPPKAGSRWTRKGNLYEVFWLTNEAATKPGWEVQVIYFQVHDSNLWSRPLSEWYGKMQEVQS